MPILTNRDKLALKANFWRWKTIMLRKKMAVCLVFLLPSIFAAVLMLTWTITGGNP